MGVPRQHGLRLGSVPIGVDRELQRSRSMVVAAFALLGILLALVETASLAPDVVLPLCGASPVRLGVYRVARAALLIACFAILWIVGLCPLFAALAGFGCAEVWMSMRRAAA